MNELKYERIRDLCEDELRTAAGYGRSQLAETIHRMETALEHLKRLQHEYNEGDYNEDIFFMAERLRQAADEIRGYSYTSLSLEIADTAGTLEQLAKFQLRIGKDS